MNTIRPQFQRMKPIYEEEPPPRDVGCPEYRHCLAEAAYKNYCLNCRLCPEANQLNEGSFEDASLRGQAVSRNNASLGHPLCST
jgi:hypothetical protein